MKNILKNNTILITQFMANHFNTENSIMKNILKLA